MARNTVPQSLISGAAGLKFDEIIRLAPNHSVVSIYNSDDVKDRLGEIYGSKCAYCESDWLGSSSPRVDHFRPKKYIKEVTKGDHHGYFWLALEWTNLILSCESCNGKKSNHFPIEDENARIPGLRINPLVHPYDSANRVLSSHTLESEGRLLLHPELDIVENHLTFLPNGEANHLSDMGEKSISVYGLNRGSLILSRKRKIDRHFQKLIDILNDYEDSGADANALIMMKRDLRYFFKELLNEQEEEVAYSRLGFFMFDNFQEFFIDRLPHELVEHKDIISNYYENLVTLNF